MTTLQSVSPDVPTVCAAETVPGVGGLTVSTAPVTRPETATAPAVEDVVGSVVVPTNLNWFRLFGMRNLP